MVVTLGEPILKLMICRSCGDVLQLRPEGERSCLCGEARGRYLEDGSTVVQTEGSISLALHNHDLRAAISAFDEHPNGWHPLMVLRAYVNPRSEPDVVFVAPPEPEDADPSQKDPARGPDSQDDS